MYAYRRHIKPWRGLALLLVSIVLAMLTCPFGFLYGILQSLTKRKRRRLGDYFKEIALGIDRLGNVIMQQMLNRYWIKPNGIKFGNPLETISSVMGKNIEKGTLTPFGNWINSMLDKIDKNHSLDSITYLIEVEGEL